MVEQHIEFSEEFTTSRNMMDGLSYRVLNLLPGMETVIMLSLCYARTSYLEDVTVQMDWIFLADCFCENLQE